LRAPSPPAPPSQYEHILACANISAENPYSPVGELAQNAHSNTHLQQAKWLAASTQACQRSLNGAFGRDQG
jgi:hypothetical protein